MLDKYRNYLCNKETMDILNRNDFLFDVDVYYNLYVVTKYIGYITFIMEASSKEMLDVVDVMYFRPMNRDALRAFGKSPYCVTEPWVTEPCVAQPDVPFGNEPPCRRPAPDLWQDSQYDHQTNREKRSRIYQEILDYRKGRG